VAYRINGITSDGDTFTMDRYFEHHDDAVIYAVEYARSVTGTDSVKTELLPRVTIVTARGDSYAERLTIEL